MLSTVAGTHAVSREMEVGRKHWNTRRGHVVPTRGTINHCNCPLCTELRIFSRNSLFAQDTNPRSDANGSFPEFPWPQNIQPHELTGTPEGSPWSLEEHFYLTHQLVQDCTEPCSSHLSNLGTQMAEHVLILSNSEFHTPRRTQPKFSLHKTADTHRSIGCLDSTETKQDCWIKLGSQPISTSASGSPKWTLFFAVISFREKIQMSGMRHKRILIFICAGLRKYPPITASLPW